MPLGFFVCMFTRHRSHEIIFFLRFVMNLRQVKYRVIHGEVNQNNFNEI
jgi:hypothetical protein